TDAPPVVTSTSASADPSLPAISSTLSFAIPRRSGSAPASRASCASACEFVSTSLPGGGSCPSLTSSSPVVSIAIRGLRRTCTRAASQGAASDSSAAPRSLPAGKTVAPARVRLPGPEVPPRRAGAGCAPPLQPTLATAASPAASASAFPIAPGDSLGQTQPPEQAERRPAASEEASVPGAVQIRPLQSI